MSRLLAPSILLAILVFVTSVPTNSQSITLLGVSDLNKTVDGTKTTYLDLIHQVLPDLKIDSTQVDVAMAHKTIPFKHLSDDAESASLEADIKLDSFQSHRVNSDGRKILLLEIDLSAPEANQGTNYEGEAVLLAGYQLQPSMKLLDVIDIKTDRFTGFWEKPAIFRLSPRTDAFLVSSSHFNAGENYTDLNILFLHNNRFDVLTNVFLFDTQGCGANVRQTPSLRVSPGGRADLPNVMVTIKVQKDPDPPECDKRTRPYTRYYKALYQWDVRKREYRTTSRQLEALDKFNRNRL